MARRAGPAHAQEVARLAGDGLGRNACARELGISRRAVDEAAKEAGVTWVRTATEAATKARMADVHAQLADDFETIADLAAERLIAALEADEMDPHVLRALANVTGTSVDQLTNLAAKLAPTDDLAAARIWVEGLQMQISAGAAGHIPPNPDGSIPIQIGPPQTTTTTTEQDQ